MQQLSLRCADLIARGIVRNPKTLARWVAQQGFPPPIQLGPRTRVWAEADVDAWISRRAKSRPRAVPRTSPIPASASLKSHPGEPFGTPDRKAN
jgi:hypothetical protein